MSAKGSLPILTVHRIDAEERLCYVDGGFRQAAIAAGLSGLPDGVAALFAVAAGSVPISFPFGVPTGSPGPPLGGRPISITDCCGLPETDYQCVQLPFSGVQPFLSEKPIQSFERVHNF